MHFRTHRSAGRSLVSLLPPLLLLPLARLAAGAGAGYNGVEIVIAPDRVYNWVAYSSAHLPAPAVPTYWGDVLTVEPSGTVLVTISASSTHTVTTTSTSQPRPTTVLQRPSTVTSTSQPRITTKVTLVPSTKTEVGQLPTTREVTVRLPVTTEVTRRPVTTEVTRVPTTTEVTQRPTTTHDAITVTQHTTTVVPVISTEIVVPTTTQLVTAPASTITRLETQVVTAMPDIVTTTAVAAEAAAATSATAGGWGSCTDDEFCETGSKCVGFKGGVSLCVPVKTRAWWWVGLWKDGEGASESGADGAAETYS
ncbi:hypothetical protein EDC01DRAFT_781753 [Geopyxis carbonaria]|nr:hypothetical protein EDC01DRAFT_781753 [Geopyxis carbonaria]